MVSREQIESRLGLRTEALATFCRRHSIRKLALFGSILRDDFHQDSDVDWSEPAVAV